MSETTDNKPKVSANEVRERLKAEKIQLKEETKKYKEDLVNVATDTVTDVRSDVKKMMVYGAALVAAYSLTQWGFKVHNKRSQKKFLKKLAKENKNTGQLPLSESKNSKIPSFGKMLRDEATTFLIGVAKEELMNYLETRKETRKKKRV
ncbi:hypothetical protein KMW28_04910 [Flammeovirga yaeyamensis]|uniref:DUF3618 domain-containing protein n=1 Tax=Flammeovirga yaeyamensis TaxID=367791 RepID=A0AAX1N5T6_9BACT|nr:MULTISPECIES: hypothetical protein [Flammeovirga]ANQ49635.1 hypothetical protein MY04_2261 [Flammeovirga sp. MY04]MBB3697497.1 methylthioribose-1-phosphate isomerase [Flammeovirga yaeyamensis]NMF36191.1 hypothetical protein [Flammeovirga yaeyamensis]QWG02923.1 hypothetical protein KMW28_04910 [Flammeovirga yaeyamensis]